MKRVIFLLIFLLSFLIIAFAENNRTVRSATPASVSQTKISARLDELDARAAELQAKLKLSHEILQKRGLAL